MFRYNFPSPLTTPSTPSFTCTECNQMYFNYQDLNNNNHNNNNHNTLGGGLFNANYSSLEDSFVLISEKESPTMLEMASDNLNVVVNNENNNLTNKKSGMIEKMEHLNEFCNELLYDRNITASTDQQQFLCCKDCIEKFFCKMENEIDLKRKEKNIYKKKLQEIQELQNNKKINNNIEEELQYLLEEEIKLRENIILLQNERNHLNRNFISLQNDNLTNQESEINYWKVFYNLMNSCKSSNEEEIEMIEKEKYYENESQILSRISPLNNMFHIWYQGDFGTINDLRLGKLSNNVSWDEINAAWGLCSLLIDIASQYLVSFKFSRFKVIPKGNESLMEDLESGEQFELYFTNQRYLTSFNNAMKYFLFCVEELCLFIEKKNQMNIHGNRLPIDEGSGKIQGLSIEYRIEKEMEWTKACKYMLINLKFIQKNWMKKM